MAEDETRMTGAEFGRWLFLAGLLAIGVALYFVYATTTRPVIHPVISEESQ
ncbi:MAG: hypothetical protein ABJD11_09585 [Gemmatimonadota bacterium]